MKKNLIITSLLFAHMAHSGFDDNSLEAPCNKRLAHIISSEIKSPKKKSVSSSNSETFRAFIVTQNDFIDPQLRQSLFSVYLTVGQEKLKGNLFSPEAVKGRCKLREILMLTKEADLKKFIENINMGFQEHKESIASAVLDKKSSLFSVLEIHHQPANMLRELFKDPLNVVLYKGKLYKQTPVKQSSLGAKRFSLCTTEELEEESGHQFSKRQKVSQKAA